MSLQCLVQHRAYSFLVLFRDEFTYKVLAHYLIKGVADNLAGTFIPYIYTLGKNEEVSTTVGDNKWRAR